MHADSVSQMTPAVDAVGRDLIRLRETAGRVVGSVFFGTLLKTMRESTLQGPYGHGGRGEEVFAAQLHDVLARRMGTRMHHGLHEAVYRSLEGQQRLIGEHRKGETKGVTYETAR